MLRIKLNNQFPWWDWLRQTPGHSGIWKDMQFHVNSDNISECDFFVVMGGLSKTEKIVCPKENTIFIALENKEIGPYSQAFLDQFGYILTHRDDIAHPRIIKTIFPAYWFIGIDIYEGRTASDKSYDFLKNNDFSDSKQKLISVISSSKIVVEGHKKRLDFIELLKNEFGSQLDVFGRGVQNFVDKWDVLSPYQYHIVLENSSFDDEITEKLYDSFLAQCYSFYYGAKNASDYFNTNSFSQIDINDPEQAVKIIRSAIANDLFTRNKPYINASKDAVLDKYNLFNILLDKIAPLRSNNLKSVAQTFYPEDLVLKTLCCSDIH